MRALLLAATVTLIGTQPSSAAALAPAEIQATFFTGQPFTAATTNIKYRRENDARANRQRRCEERGDLEAFEGRFLHDLERIQGQLLSH